MVSGQESGMSDLKLEAKRTAVVVIYRKGLLGSRAILIRRGR